MNFSTFIKIVLTFWSVELREILYYKYLVVTNIQSVYILETIVLKPGPARRVNPGLEPGRVEEKIEEEKTRWPGWPSKTRSKAGCNSLAFVFFFFTKTTSFWFKKNELTRWPGQNPKPGPWTGLAIEPGLKIMLETNLSLFEFDQRYLA